MGGHVDERRTSAVDPLIRQHRFYSARLLSATQTLPPLVIPGRRPEGPCGPRLAAKSGTSFKLGARFAIPQNRHADDKELLYSIALVLRGVASSRLVSELLIPEISRIRRNTASRADNEVVPSSTTRSQRPLVV